MRTLWAIVVAICLIATGASRVRAHDDGHRDPREAKHAALRTIAASALIAAPGRAHGGPDGAPAAPLLRHEPPARRHVPVARALAPDGDAPDRVDATSHRSRAPPTTDSIPS